MREYESSRYKCCAIVNKYEIKNIYIILGGMEIVENKISIVVEVEDDTVELDVDEKIVKEWINTYKKYSPMLKPNQKTIAEVIEYIKSKYSMVENEYEKYKSVVVSNITMNKVFAERIPNGKELNPIIFFIKNEGNARALYENREAIYKDVPIIIGMESETGFVSVEGSKELYDEIVAFKGLDSYELTNFYLVSNYVRCLKKYNKLKEVLNHVN